MKSSKTIWFSFTALLLLITARSRAEGGCPQGMLPAAGPNNISSCAPIPPGYYQQRQAGRRQSPILWEHRWGAIATDFSQVTAGASVDQPNEERAAESALENCKENGGKICKVELTYHDQCAALVVGRTGHNSGSASTIDLAEQQGIDVCNASGDTNCRAYYTACSLPVRAN